MWILGLKGLKTLVARPGQGFINFEPIISLTTGQTFAHPTEEQFTK